MIELNCDLRAYPIALLFVLLACNAFLDWLHDSTNSRALTRFGIFTALGLFTEFFVVFFIAGCFAILALRCALNPDFRTALRTSLREHSRQWAVAAGIPMLVFLGFFTFHKTARMEDLPYLRDYIWSSEHHTDPISFLYSNIVHEASYFASLGLSPAAVLALLFLFILPGLFYFLLKRRDLANGIFSATPIVLAGAILAQIMVLALAAKYPFGGEFRHQSIAVPFLFLAVFLLLDLLAGVLSAPMFRHGLFMLAGAVTAANFAYGLTTYAWHEPEPRAADYIRFRQQFPAAENIYADQSSAIYFYGQHNAAKWTLLHHYLLNDQNVFSYTVESGYAAPFRFIRIREQTWFDPAAPLSYQLLAAAMREEKIGSAVLYFVSRTWDDDATTALRELIRKHAPAAGISVGRNDIGRDYAFIEFQLK